MGAVGLNRDNVPSILDAVGIRADLRGANAQGWNDTLAKLAYVPVAYDQAEIDYQLAYQRGAEVDCRDISLILRQDNRLCGVWPLSYASQNGKVFLNSYGLPVLPPLFVKDLAEKSKKALIKRCLDFSGLICKEMGIDDWQSSESFVDEMGLGDWHEQSMQRGAAVSLQHELFVDLLPDMSSIKAKFRKSYKSLVTAGLRTWQVGVLNESSPELWNKFRLLHQKVSGRATRSIETWNLQHQAIVEGHAFLVHLHDTAGELVGGGYFVVTRDEGVYRVGVYDRALFAQPLGHVVQYRAIEEMKSRGLRWYKIGYRPYPSQEPSPTQKEISIGEFKQGFSTHLFPQYVLHHVIRSAATK